MYAVSGTRRPNIWPGATQLSLKRLDLHPLAFSRSSAGAIAASASSTKSRQAPQPTTPHVTGAGLNNTRSFAIPCTSAQMRRPLAVASSC